MKAFGIREICDVVLKAKAAQKIGNKVFYKHEPVIYFDTLKTSTLEGAATTVYATGGRGNSRLVAWEGERTVTFTMEDALISPEGLMILTGAGLIEANKGKTLKVHNYEQTDNVVVDAGEVGIILEKKPYGVANAQENFVYVMKMEDGVPATEPYIPTKAEPTPMVRNDNGEWEMGEAEAAEGWKITLQATDDIDIFVNGDVVLVDYYAEEQSGAQQIEITPDKFGGNYYLEASTLFRTTDGVDMPAEFVIPNCKIQSNFTFSMASSGDPSTFTFTLDAFPDYTRFDKTKKVLAAVQIIETAGTADLTRTHTAAQTGADWNAQRGFFD